MTAEPVTKTSTLRCRTIYWKRPTHVYEKGGLNLRPLWATFSHPSYRAAKVTELVYLGESVPPHLLRGAR